MILSHILKKPSLSGGTGWLNSEPLSFGSLRGKIILVDFWTYSCVNCLRTLPYIKRWHKKYSKAGLVVVGVHSPEFEFEKKLENVQEAVEGLGIKYPVILDSKYKIFKSFGNRVWPHKFLFDRSGKLRYEHSGEGNYEEMEEEIRKLLSDEMFMLRSPKGDEKFTPRNEVRESNLKIEKIPLEKDHTHRFGAVCYPQTPELYCGWSRGICTNKGGFRRNRRHVYTEESERRRSVYTEEPEGGKGVYTEEPRRRRGAGINDGQGISLQGTWKSERECLSHLRESNLFEDYLLILVKGVEVNAVCSPSSKRSFRVEVKFDGEYLDKKMVGEDVRFAPNGQTYFEVSTPRMYQIVKSKKYFQGKLQLFSNSADFKIYAFTFGGCI